MNDWVMIDRKLKVLAVPSAVGISNELICIHQNMNIKMGAAIAYS